jgi:hypothetical protein
MSDDMNQLEQGEYIHYLTDTLCVRQPDTLQIAPSVRVLTYTPWAKKFASRKAGKCDIGIDLIETKRKGGGMYTFQAERMIKC